MSNVMVHVHEDGRELGLLAPVQITTPFLLIHYLKPLLLCECLLLLSTDILQIFCLPILLSKDRHYSVFRVPGKAHHLRNFKG
ncbi:hypothetical protein RIF29_16755 [Crotalaria pallida]|uniref:Uncharacterized protein n=1 Tax=Crotalaria pallida TaxID=3830 RepID=A0AAN9IFU9_CROPI